MTEKKKITLGEIFIAACILAVGLFLTIRGFQTYSSANMLYVGMGGIIILFSIFPLYVAVFLIHKKRPKEQKLKEKEETLRVIGFLLWIAFVFTLLPAGIIFIYYLIKLVIIGDIRASYFFRNFSQYSYEPVFDFYVSMCQKGADFIYRRH